MPIFDFIICVVFDNMFKIFKDPDEKKPFLGLSWAILDIYVCLFVILAFVPKRYEVCIFPCVICDFFKKILP